MLSWVVALAFSGGVAEAPADDFIVMEMVRTGPLPVVRTGLSETQRGPLCARGFCRDEVPDPLPRPTVVGTYLYYSAELEPGIREGQRVKVSVEQMLHSKRAYEALVLLGLERVTR